jgi:hypothetical protein
MARGAGTVEGRKESACTEHQEERERQPDPELASDEAVISEALHMLHELDDTPPQQMTALFYQHGFEQLSMTTRDLLRVLGHDPDA